MRWQDRVQKSENGNEKSVGKCSEEVEEVVLVVRVVVMEVVKMEVVVVVEEW